MYSQKSPKRFLTIALSIFALAFPRATYISVVWVLALVLFFVGIEEILVGIFSPRKSRWSTIESSKQQLTKLIM